MQSTDGAVSSMERDGLIGRILHGVDPPATAWSMEEHMHPWMKILHPPMRTFIHG